MTSQDNDVLTESNFVGFDVRAEKATRSAATNCWSAGGCFFGDSITAPWPS